jgi:hypothetical protein
MELAALAAGGTTGIIVLVGYALYKILKNSSCRSNCCGKVSSLSVHLEQEAFPTSKPPDIISAESKDAPQDKK